MYFAIWESFIGEDLPCEMEEDNNHDPYAVSMIKRR